MDYFRIRNLKQEPFSNSPDPDFFFASTVHLACLQQLEIAIRLRRGLNVVLGDVGTGKTTLCRQLICRFTETPEDLSEIQTHLMLDPAFSTPREFLAALATLFGVGTTGDRQSEWQLKEGIKHFLFQKGVDENKTVLLIVDEGQKLSEFCREILRELLNYDTNEKKLLQIVIFAQNEFHQILRTHSNFADRVNQCYLLGPLNFGETREMIRFRLSRAGHEGPPLFTLPALWAIYRRTGGYPRRIVTLCHHILLAMIIRNRPRAGWFLVADTTRKLVPEQGRGKRFSATTAALTVILLLVSAALFYLPAPQRTVVNVAPPVPIPVETAKTDVPPPAAPPLLPAVKTGTTVVPPAAAAKPPTAVPGAGQTSAQPSAAAKPAPPATGAVTATAAPAATPAAAAKPAPPKTIESLGKIKINAGDSLSLLLPVIYGSGGASPQQAVMKANPHVADLNRIAAGEVITLPAIPASKPPLAPDKVWVQLARKGSLEEALRLLKLYPSDMPPIRLVPSWSPREGLAFVIVLKTGFPGVEAAREAMEHLPTGAKLLEKADQDTLYFAN